MNQASNQVNPVQELRKLEQMQANLLLNVNLVLKKDIREYLNKQEKILDEQGVIKEEVVEGLIAMFMEFAKDIILHQERVRKVENQEKITAKDIDDQLHQANLFNWWTGKQINLYHKLKKIYHLQRAKEYDE